MVLTAYGNSEQLFLVVETSILLSSPASVSVGKGSSHPDPVFTVDCWRCAVIGFSADSPFFLSAQSGVERSLAFLSGTSNDFRPRPHLPINDVFVLLF